MTPHHLCPTCKGSGYVPVLPESNPCTNNGCTDIDQCDEICEHQRIYTQAQMDAVVAKARNQTLDELSLPRDAVLRFSRIMETKLRENDGIRDGWEECDPVWLFERAEEEMKELKNEIQMYMNHSSLSPKWLSIKERVQREAADVANFCMMISDNIESLRTGGEP